MAFEEMDYAEKGETLYASLPFAFTTCNKGIGSRPRLIFVLDISIDRPTSTRYLRRESQTLARAYFPRIKLAKRDFLSNSLVGLKRA